MARQSRSARMLRDILLLPPALIYVLIEHVFWAGAKVLLDNAARLPPVNAMQERLKLLPPWAVLPLFLIPEIVSHIGGFWATYLLVQRKYLAAMLAGIVIKGLATLLVVWIYQSCEPALMAVAWFRTAHGWMVHLRDWVAKRLQKLRDLAGRGRSRLARRFAAIRIVLAARLGISRK